jgi:hypothetical protein
VCLSDGPVSDVHSLPHPSPPTVVKKLRDCLPAELWEGRAPAHAPPQPTPPAVGRGHFHGRAARAQLGEAARDRSRGVRALGKGRVRRTAHARANQPSNER